MMMLFSGGFSPAMPAHLTVLQDIFGAPNVAHDWADWQTWLNHLRPRDLAKELLDAIAQQQGKKRTVWERGTFLDTKLSFDAGVFRLEHFLLWFDQRCGLLDPRLRRAVLDYVRRSGALAGKRGQASTRTPSSRRLTTCSACTTRISR